MTVTVIIDNGKTETWADGQAFHANDKGILTVTTSPPMLRPIATYAAGSWVKAYEGTPPITSPEDDGGDGPELTVGSGFPSPPGL